MSRGKPPRDITEELRSLRAVLRSMASLRDCDYLDAPESERPDPCNCPTCLAKEVLQADPGVWRFQGAAPERRATSPRERKIVEAWQRQMSDHKLAMILTGRGEVGPEPSERDWFVATTIVQWLATNVGMGILEAAGWRYQGWDEDRKERDAREEGRQ